MSITVKLFAILRERAGVDAFRLDLRDGATVAEAAAMIGERFPPAREHLRRVAYAVNREYAAATTALRDGDELAIIPPVSGGCA
jgi:molybdopterin converting factor subunit 1